MKRKALLVVAESLDKGGVESYLASSLPRSGLLDDFWFTYLVPGRIISESVAEGFRQLGIRLVVEGLDGLDRFRRRAGLRKAVDRLLSQDCYDVLHVNTGVKSVQAISCSAAKRAGVPVRIAHSHSAIGKSGSLPGRIVSPFLSPLVVANATELVACSDAAGEYLFGAKAWNERGVLAKGGIDLEEFSFSDERRASVREGLGEDVLVLGMVARFARGKNQMFLLEAFAELHARQPRSELWFVGDGPLRAQVEDRARELGLSSACRFLGVRDDVGRLLSGFDVFLLPSDFEGLPISVIEAQASGLPCFLSRGVPEEVDVSGCDVTHLDLTLGPGQWADALLSAPLRRAADGAEMVRAAGYDAAETALLLRSLYLPDGRVL